jgi:hypothetical protein
MCPGILVISSCIPAPEKRYHVPGVMKEQDVRQRIEGFLKRTARELMMP